MSPSPGPTLASLFIDFSASGTSFTMAQALLFPPLSTSFSRSAIVVCHSSSSKPIPAAANTPQQQQTTPPTPLLADQLHPVIIGGHRSQTASDETNEPHLLPPRKPKSTWPRRLRSKSLSLQRCRKASEYHFHPSLLRDLKITLSMVSDKLNSLHLPEDVNDASALASFSSALDDFLPFSLSRDTALFLLKGLRPWHMNYRFLQWLKSKSFPLETILYNETMKRLRVAGRNDLVGLLALEMVGIGVDFDNVTYSIVITAAKHRHQYQIAMQWFERMSETGLMPDPVTCTAMMDVYASVGAVDQVMYLFERERASGWTPDTLAFAVLLRMFGAASDYGGLEYVLREMKNLGVEADVVVYNALLKGLEQAGNPSLALEVFEQMLEAGLAPNEKTLTVLIKCYGKAKWNKDVLKLWERIKSSEWPVDCFLCNTMLAEFVRLGLVSQAEDLFAEMKASEDCRPNHVGYTAMVKMYAAAGEYNKALQVFEEMLKQGIWYIFRALTCLIQCYGKAGRVDDVVRLFDVALERGIRPNDQLSCDLLSVIATCQEAEMNKVLACLDKVGPRYVKLIRLLSSDDVPLCVIRDEFRAILNAADAKFRELICNRFIDVCQNKNFPPHKAQELFSFGVVYGIYPNLHSETSDEWSLDLSSLSEGAAYTAFENWVSTLAGKINTEGALPQLFSIHTGTTASHKSDPSCDLASHLKELAAPFRQGEKGRGHFTATREELVSWMQARASRVPSHTSDPIV